MDEDRAVEDTRGRRLAGVSRSAAAAGGSAYRADRWRHLGLCRRVSGAGAETPDASSCGRRGNHRPGRIARQLLESVVPVLLVSFARSGNSPESVAALTL